MIYGALEAGGTKMVCATFDEQGTMLDRVSIKTETPDVTMPKLIEYFKDNNVVSLGIGSFGPLDLNPNSKHFGYISTTPKLPWRNFPLMPEFKKALNIPVKLDTDVNAAALAEAKLGAAKGLSSCLYVTVGTGIGGGLYINDKLVHGLVHPELGHILVKLHDKDIMPNGICPSHGCCLEGLASGPSIEKRWGISSKELPDDHIAWEIEAYYLAQMCVSVLLIASPEKIILGGGVMQRKHIFSLIHRYVKELLNNYVDHNIIKNNIQDYILEPGLGVNSGITGSYLLAKEALQEN